MCFIKHLANNKLILKLKVRKKDKPQSSKNTKKSLLSVFYQGQFYLHISSHEISKLILLFFT